MKNILVVFGTRPEVIKLAPLILELKKYKDDYNVIVCNTEQQKELSNQTLTYFNLKADINLDCMRENQSLIEVQSRILMSLEKVYAENTIDATIIQGDTMTVLCAALASFYRKIPVFHVEAGLRSYDIYEPFQFFHPTNKLILFLRFGNLKLISYLIVFLVFYLFYTN